jgi:glycyl-tRNA synthetase beta chain
MSRDFLVEIGTEELPPKSLLALAAAFEQGITKGLAEAGLVHGKVERFATPRRLAVRVRKLAVPLDADLDWAGVELRRERGPAG